LIVYYLILRASNPRATSSNERNIAEINAPKDAKELLNVK
jgi:hypothetical protein